MILWLSSLFVFMTEAAQHYPWTNRLLSLDAAHVLTWLSTTDRNCSKDNLTLLPDGYSYLQFERMTSSWQKINQIDPVTMERLCSSLAGWSKLRNPHVEYCLPAVYRALNLALYSLLSDPSVLSDTNVWFKTVSEHVQELNQVLLVLRCDACGPKQKGLVLQSLSTNNRWLAHSKWVVQLLKETLYRNNNLAVKYEEIEMQTKNHHLPDLAYGEEHFSLFRSGNALLNRLKDEGFLQYWVIHGGSLIYALRYGQTWPPLLPSGLADRPHDSEMEVYVYTDKWTSFVERLHDLASEYGFPWCGSNVYMVWYKDTYLCKKTGFDLEVWLVKDPAMVRSLFPLSKCLVSMTSREGQRENLELPCPHDPMAFLTAVYHGYFDLNLIAEKKSLDYYLGCLALPLSKKPITEEDIRHMWQIAQKLHGAGYASMAPHYANCRGHPLAAFAASLIKNVPALEK